MDHGVLQQWEFILVVLAIVVGAAWLFERGREAGSKEATERLRPLQPTAEERLLEERREARKREERDRDIAYLTQQAKETVLGKNRYATERDVERAWQELEVFDPEWAHNNQPDAQSP